MRVVVTGATGFTGSHTVPLLLERGCEVRCFVRKTSDLSLLPGGPSSPVYGNLDDPASLQAALNGADALVNIASLGFGHAAGIVEAALKAQVQRAVFISTTAIFTKLNAASKRVRVAAEDYIRASDLSYTILRPTMIYGSRKDRNMCRLVRFLRRWPVVPVVGSGEYLQQPVYVQDLATAIVSALFSPCTVRRCYNVPGGNALTYTQVIETICAILRKKARIVKLPMQPIVAVLKLLEAIGLKPPVKAEQVLRLAEHKAFDFKEAREDFAYGPRPFAAGIAEEIADLFPPVVGSKPN